MLHDLTNQSLNGLYGTVICAYDGLSGRIGVDVDGEGLKSIKPANLSFLAWRPQGKWPQPEAKRAGTSRLHLRVVMADNIVEVPQLRWAPFAQVMFSFSQAPQRYSLYLDNKPLQPTDSPGSCGCVDEASLTLQAKPATGLRQS